MTEVPAGSELQIRLTKRATTDLSKAKDPLEAVLIAPVIVNGQVAIPSGVRLRGQIEELARYSPEKRASLRLKFDELIPQTGKSLKVKTRLVNVDNARESVDDAGRVLGILASETIASRINQGIAKVAAKNPALAEVLGSTKDQFIKDTNAEIDYLPGVEMTLRLLEPVRWQSGGDTAQPALRALGTEEESSVYNMVNRQPFRTYAEKTNRESDVTNLMFIGNLQDVEQAFHEAGWSTAHALNDQSVMETFRAIVELRGYKEAPVSTLVLDGVRPDLVFQKQNNTFAMRHHLRIWRRPGSLFGKPVWVAAATHDNGIVFSEDSYTFTHSIDPQIDKERAKIVSDLLFTKKVQSLALVERPNVPQRETTATGNPIETDGRMAVVIF